MNAKATGGSSRTGIFIGLAALAAGLWYLSTRKAAAAPAIAQSAGSPGAVASSTATAQQQLMNQFTLQPINVTPLSASTVFGTGTPTVGQQGMPGTAAAGAQANQLVNAQYELPASAATTSGLNQAAALFWDSLTPRAALSSGWIVDPAGSQAPLADFTNGLTATDIYGNVYVLWGTDVYKLGPKDAAGNRPGELVAGG